MAKFVVLSLFIAASSWVTAVKEEEIAAFRKAITPIVAICSTQYGVKRSDIEAARDNNNVDGIKPCFVACVLKKTGVLNNNGYYDAQTGLSNLRKFVSDESDFEQFDKVAQICTKVNEEPVNDGAAGCERAKMLLTCAIENEHELPL